MFITSALAVAFIVGQQYSIERIPIVNTRASKVVEMMGPLLNENGPKLLEANDKGSFIVVSVKSKEQFDEIARFVKVFDVKPRQVEFKIWLWSQADKLASDITATVANNATFKIIDESVGADLSIKPRINADNTVTFTLKELGQPEWVMRIKSGETIFILEPTGHTTAPQLVRPEGPCRMNITVTIR